MTTTTTTAISSAFPMTVRADWMAGPAQGCWTFADYLALPEDGHRYEVINGVLHRMAAPNIAHQETVTRTGYHLTGHVLVGGLGRVFVAPVDVYLGPHASPVQPDVVVVLNAKRDIIKEKFIEGVPDLVVEVSSPGTVGHDRRVKQDAYARAGVPEYWLPDPYAHTIEVLVLAGAEYRSVGVFSGDQTLPSLVLPDFRVPVAHFFA